jgi:hypothetical protein
VTGSIILLQQIYEQRFGSLPKVSDVVGWLKAGAKPITDSITGATIGRIDVLKAAAQIPAAPTTTTTNTQSANSNTSSSSDSTNGSQSSGSSSSSSNSTSTQQSNSGDTSQSNQSSSNSAPTGPAQVNLFINGQSAGQADATSNSNPFANYASLFGVNVTFQRVQVWNSSASSVGSGSAAPSGEIGAAVTAPSKPVPPSSTLGTGPTVRIATRQPSVFEDQLLSQVGHVTHGKTHMAGRKVAVNHRRG